MGIMSTKRRFFPNDAVVTPAIASVFLAFSAVLARADDGDVSPGGEVPSTVGEAAGKDRTEVGEDPRLTPDEIMAAIAKLDSEDFVERENTQTALWKAGAQAESALEEVVKSGSAEARFRASRVLERFRFGIYPDTPKEIVALVQSFRRGGMDERTNAISELARRGMFEIVRRLVETVEDEEQAETLARAAARESEEPARALIAKGDLEGAAKILRMSAVTREAMQNFATFCVLSGTAEHEREVIRNGTMRENEKLELLHWIARVEGDFPEALALAEKIGEPELLRDTKIASGDLIAFAEGAEDLRLRTLKALGFRAAAQRLKGEDDALKETVKEIVKYAAEHPSEAAEIHTALVINGAVDEALEVVRKASPKLAFSHLMEQERFEEAMAIKGMPGPRPPYDAWLGEQVRNFKEGDDTDEGTTAMRSLAEFSGIAAFLYGRGERAYLDKMCGSLAEAAADKSAMTNIYLARYLRGLESREAYLACAERALATGQKLEQVLDIYDENSTLAVRWSTFLQGRRKLDPKEALGLIDTLLSPEGKTTLPPEAESMIAEASEIANKAGPEDAEEAAEWHRTLADSLGLWGQWERSLGHLRAALEIGGDDGILPRRIASILLYQRKWEEAAAAFGKLVEEDDADETNSYLHGLALVRAGKVAEGEAIMRRIDLQMLGDTSRRADIEALLWNQGEVELAERQSRLVLALARPFTYECAKSCNYLALRLRYTTREEEAVVMMERQMLQTLKGGNYLSSLRSPVSSASALLSIKARVKLRQGDPDAAITLAERALAISPGDSALLEYLYPMLVESDRKAAADALFERVYEVSKKGVEMFPNYGQANNNHAWLLARCGQHLDEALFHANKAVEIEPNSSASVDTLAEVYFARGDFKKAAEVSDRAVSLAPSDAQLQEQNVRFHAAAGDGKPSPEASAAPNSPDLPVP